MVRVSSETVLATPVRDDFVGANLEEYPVRMDFEQILGAGVASREVVDVLTSTVFGDSSTLPMIESARYGSSGSVIPTPGIFLNVLFFPPTVFSIHEHSVLGIVVIDPHRSYMKESVGRECSQIGEGRLFEQIDTSRCNPRGETAPA